MLSILKKFWHWRNRDKLILLFLVIVVSTADLIWRAIDTRPPSVDMGRHLMTSLNYYNLFLDHKYLSLVTAYTYYPPLVYWLTISFYALLGTSLIVSVSANVVFVAMLVFSVYGIGKYLWSNKVGLLSAIFVVFTPMLAMEFKHFELDAPLTAIVALALYLLIRSEEFTNKKYSLLFGAIFGLGMLTKWTFTFFLIAPLLFAFFKCLIKCFKLKKFYLGNFLLSALIAYAIAMPWYLFNHSQILNDYLYNAYTVGEMAEPKVGTLLSNITYPNALISTQLYLIPSIMFLAGLVFCFMKVGRINKNIYLLLMIFGGLFILTLLPHKDYRYSLPILSGVAIIGVYWIGKIKNIKGKNFLGTITVLYFFLSFFIISFGTKLLPQSIEFSVGGPFGVIAFAQHGYLTGPPRNENWHQEDIFKLMSQSQEANKTFFFEDIVTNWLNGFGLDYYSVRCNMRQVSRSENPTFILIRGRTKQAVSEGYYLIEQYTLPDQSYVELFQKSTDNS